MLEEYRSRCEGFWRFCGQDAVDVSLKRSVGQCAESACKWRICAQIRWVWEVWFFACVVRGARCHKKTACYDGVDVFEGHGSENCG